MLQTICPQWKRARDHISECTWIKCKYQGNTILSTIAKLVFNACIYHIWWERNQRRFGDTNRTRLGIIQAITFDVHVKIRDLCASIEEMIKYGHILSKWDVMLERDQTTSKECRWIKSLGDI